jgi:cell division protein FtsB
MDTESEKTNEQLRQENEELRHQNRNLIAALDKASRQLVEYDTWAKKVAENYRKLREKISNLE